MYNTLKGNGHKSGQSLGRRSSVRSEENLNVKSEELQNGISEQ